MVSEGDDYMGFPLTIQSKHRDAYGHRPVIVVN